MYQIHPKIYNQYLFHRREYNQGSRLDWEHGNSERARIVTPHHKIQFCNCININLPSSPIRYYPAAGATAPPPTAASACAILLEIAMATAVAVAVDADCAWPGPVIGEIKRINVYQFRTNAMQPSRTSVVSNNLYNYIHIWLGIWSLIRLR